MLGSLVAALVMVISRIHEGHEAATIVMNRQYLVTIFVTVALVFRRAF
jgi:hypothetical protein